MDKKIYNINQYHKHFINLFITRRNQINENNEIYNNKIKSIISDIDKKLEAQALVDINNLHDIQIIKYDIEMLNNDIKKINDILNFNEEKEYYKYTNEYITKFNSTDTNGVKYMLSIFYMIIVDPEKYFKNIKSKIRNNKCINCKSPSHMKTISPGVYQCIKCMYITSDISENVLISDINPNTTLKNNSYQKSNYFESYINKLRMTKVPRDSVNVLAEIKSYANKYCINNFTTDNIRRILKYIGKSNYYKYISYFMCKLTNNFVPPNISSEDLEKLSQMFNEVEAAWVQLICKKNGKKQSFFGYPYVMRKLLELLEDYDNYLPLIPLSNSTSNINKNDKIWSQICEYLRYEFIPTYKFS
jgi:ribosomal protein L37AE/L43A